VGWWVGLRPTHQLMAADLRIRRAQYLWDDFSLCPERNRQMWTPGVHDIYAICALCIYKLRQFLVPIYRGEN